MSAAPLLTFAAEAETSGVNPFLVGAIVLALLAIAVFALLAYLAFRASRLRSTVDLAAGSRLVR